MTVRQLRRLEPAPKDRFEWAVRMAAIRAFWLDRQGFERLRVAAPSRVIDEPAGIVAGELRRLRPEMLVHFAFLDRRACEERFGPMFERLLEATPDRSVVRDGFVVEFTDRPNRNYVEPALKQQGFEVDQEWLEFALVDLDLALEARGAGARLVAAGPEDRQAFAEASMAYGAEPLSTDGIDAALAEGHRLRWLESSGARVGYVRLSMRPRGSVGVVHDLAVVPDLRRKGLGTALLRLALEQLRGMGAVEAAARVNIENAAGIALLRRAGFRQADAGVTYRRPADDEEVRRRFEAKRGHAVKFGGWR